MIKNLIFDMGNVIMHYDPVFFTSRIAETPEEAAILKEQVFGSKEWAMLDEGTITLEAFDDLLRERTGALYDKAHDLLYHWHRNLPVYTEMEELMADLKAKGYHLYLLSNAGTQFHTYKSHIPAFKYLDGMLISADVQLLKPDPRIYFTLFTQYSLNPFECFFIDDSLKNIEGGKELGMDGYCYKDGNISKLIHALTEKNIL